MAKANAAKGAKKGRRFGRPRSAAAMKACALRKEQRIADNKARKDANDALRAAGIPTAWEKAKEARRAARKHLQRGG